MLESPARRAFKEMTGQNNHFLITILVGLAAVEDGTAMLRPEMRTSWAPRDSIRSAARSREFAIKAMLAWLVDAIDTYIRMLARDPIVANPEVLDSIQIAIDEEEGIAGKVRRVAAATGQARSAEAVLVEMAITWRNRLVHLQSKSKISKPLIKDSLTHAAQFTESYRGLVIEDLIKRAQRQPATAPTVKEITAMVRAAHKFIERVDGYLLTDLDLERYLRETLYQYLTENKELDPGSVMSRSSNVWGRSLERRKSTIVQIALNRGFSGYRDGAPNKLSETAIERLANLTPAQAVAELNSATPGKEA